MAERSRSKRSRDETRQLMLEAGAQLVYEAFDAPSAADWAPVAHVRLTDVASRASEISPGSATITTGAIYPIWEDQNAYRHDLILHLLSPRRRQTDDLWASFVDLATSPDRPDSVEEMIELVCRSIWREVHDRAFYHAHYMLAPYRDPAVSEAVHEYFLAEREALVPFYRVAYMAYGVRPRDNLSYLDVSRSVGALLDGFILSHLAELQTSATESHRSLEDLWVDAASAVLLGFAVPSGSTTPRSD